MLACYNTECIEHKNCLRFSLHEKNVRDGKMGDYIEEPKGNAISPCVLIIPKENNE
jgi:hypothetical protein